MPEAKAEVTAFLEEVAARATTLMNLEERRAPDKAFTIALGKPTDISMMWKCAAVHPLQPLQNIHQRIVRTLAGGAPEGEKKQHAESTLLGKFYILEPGDPALLGGAKAPAESPEVVIDKIREKLKEWKVELMPDEPPNDRKAVETYTRLKPEVDAVISELETEIPKWGTSQKVNDGLAKVKTAAGKALTAEQLKTVCNALLKNVLEPVDALAGGVASIRMLYMIEPFYLFRLQVSFRVSSPDPLTDGFKKAASAKVTGLLHQRQIWLRAWHKKQLVDLDRALAALDADNIRFFVKGGRALRFLLKESQLEENDWDTQLLINPNLRPPEWYALFAKVHNLVLEKLTAAKRDFLTTAHPNLDDAEERLGEAVTTMKADIDEKLAKAPLPGVQPVIPVVPVVDDVQRDKPAEIQALEDAGYEVDDLPESTAAACKAELIDIGIPRYDSPEALEQWHALVQHDGILPTGHDATASGAADARGAKPAIVDKDPGAEGDRPPIPGPLYYLEEYLLMIREGFAEKSLFMNKIPKRLARFVQILGNADAKQVVEAQLALVKPELLPKALAAVKATGDEKARAALTILLVQFMKAYDLAQNPGLSAKFDQMFSDRWKDLEASPDKVPFPAKFARPADGTAEKPMTTAVGFGHVLSKEVEVHFRDRGAFFLNKAQRGKLTHLIKALYSAAHFEQESELEVQFALAGSFAAHLFAEYAGLPAERMESLDPLDVIDIKVYGHPPRMVGGKEWKIDPESVKEILLVPALEEYLKNTDVNKFAFKKEDVENVKGGPIRVTWPEEAQLGALKYKPLAVRISVVPDHGWPLLSYIWGLPVISLADLVREYHHKSAEILEFGSQQRLKNTVATLSELLTRFEARGV